MSSSHLLKRVPLQQIHRTDTAPSSKLLERVHLANSTIRGIEVIKHWTDINLIKMHYDHSFHDSEMFSFEYQRFRIHFPPYSLNHVSVATKQLSVVLSLSS